MSRHFKVELSTGVIDIYDGYVPMRTREVMWEYLSKDCGWFLGWQDGLDKDPHLHAVITECSQTAHDIKNTIADDERFKQRVRGHELGIIVANLSHSAAFITDTLTVSNSV